VSVLYLTKFRYKILSRQRVVTLEVSCITRLPPPSTVEQRAKAKSIDQSRTMDQTRHQYYAVRVGYAIGPISSSSSPSSSTSNTPPINIRIKSAIFINWNDAKQFVNNAEPPPSSICNVEYSTFDSISDADKYLFEGEQHSEWRDGSGFESASMNINNELDQAGTMDPLQVGTMDPLQAGTLNPCGTGQRTIGQATGMPQEGASLPRPGLPNGPPRIGLPHGLTTSRGPNHPRLVAPMDQKATTTIGTPPARRMMTIGTTTGMQRRGTTPATGTTMVVRRIGLRQEGVVRLVRLDMRCTIK